MSNERLNNIFAVKKPIIGMIHVWDCGYKDYRQMSQALDDLEKLQPFVDGIIVENYGWGYEDSNFATNEVEEIIGRIAGSVVKNSKIPVGINILPNDYIKALQIAQRTGCQFIQMDHIVGKFYCCRSVVPENFLAVVDSFPDIAILGGVHPKYYQPVDPSVTIEESAMKAKSLADAIVVTGKYTGGEASLEDLKKVKSVIGEHPLFIGSGLNKDNAKNQLSIADGAIVGTAFKKKGVVKGEPIDGDMVKRLMEVVKN